MALSVKVGSFTPNGSTGNQAITGVGFQPKVVLFYGYRTGGGGWIEGFFGAASSSTARWVSLYHHRDFADKVARKLNTGKCIEVTDHLSTNGSADFVSNDSDGFTINVTQSFSATSIAHYIAIGGTDVSALVGSFDSNTTTGNQSVTGVGFQPKSVLFGFAAKNTTGALDATASSLGVGWGLSSSSRGSTNHFINTDVSTNSQAIELTTRCIVHITAALAIDEEADYVSNDADGFTVNWVTKSATAIKIGYVALGGTAQYFAGSFNQPASTGNQAVTGTGFTPSLEVFLSQGKAANASATAEGRIVVGGATSSSNRGYKSVTMQNAVDSTTNPDFANGTTKTIRHLSTAGATETEADFVSQDADGFTVNWSTADATAREHIYLAVGAAAGGAGGQIPNWPTFQKNGFWAPQLT